ncbi:MAG: DPP IV N-terminal domain-containing protein, partial [Streptosporangiaceae bacterium]
MSDRYAHATALAPEGLSTLMRNRWVEPHWTGVGDTFWYCRDRDDHGREFILLDPEDPDHRSALFDHNELASQLSLVLGSEVDPHQLPVTGYQRDPAGRMRITLSDGRTLLAAPEGGFAVEERRTDVLASSDGRHELFCRERELWLHDTVTGEERPLTTGGEPYCAWGALPDNSLVRIPMRRAGKVLPPVFTAFSPSGRIVVTARLDERAAAEWPFVEYLPADQARPRLHLIRGTLDDEQRAADPQLAFINLETGKDVVITGSDNLLAGLLSTGMDALTWGIDEECVYLFSHSPGNRTAALWRIDVATGDRRVVVSETDDPIYEPNTFLYSLPLIRVLPRSNEVIWFSQRDGWGHLYRYDLATGRCLNPITTGHLVVRDLVRVDANRREVLLLAGCGENGHNPYWRKLYRASMDGGPPVLLTPEPADHEMPTAVPQFFAVVFGTGSVSPVSPSGRYVIDHMSTVEEPPEIVLRETRGGLVAGVLERTDVTSLLAAGYR